MTLKSILELVTPWAKTYEPSSCTAPIDTAQTAITKQPSSPKDYVKWNNSLTVILIPTIEEYIEDHSFNLLWYPHHKEGKTREELKQEIIEKRLIRKITRVAIASGVQFEEVPLPQPIEHFSKNLSESFLSIGRTKKSR